MQVNQTAFGFVQQTVADSLEHHGKTETDGGRNRIGGGGNNGFGNHRHTVPPQDPFGLRFRQSIFAGLKSLF